MLRLITAVLALMHLAAPARADENWPRFRGPDGAGIGHAEIPAKWTDRDYNWKTPLGGGGHSSPVVWGSRIFLTIGQEPDAQKNVRASLLALDVNDGKLLWKMDEALVAPRMGPAASATPAVDGDAVYALWESPKGVFVVAADHAGKELWRADFGPMRRTRGAGVSPIVCGDVVVFTNEASGRNAQASTWVALDRKTGKLKWELPRQISNKDSYSTPCLRAIQGAAPHLLFTSSAHGITAVEPSAGKVLWELKTAVPVRAVGSPFFAGDTLVVTCGDTSRRRLSAFRIDPAAAGGAFKEAFAVEGKTACYVPTPVCHGDLLFTFEDGGQVSCLRLTGGEVLWSEKPSAQGFQGSPVAVNGRIYCMNTAGEVIVLAAGAKYDLLAVNPLGEKSMATPAVAGGRMYLRTWSHLISVGGRGGGIPQAPATRSAGASRSPAAAGGVPATRPALHFSKDATAVLPLADGIDLALVRIPAGTFRMGTRYQESGFVINEHPQRVLSVDRPPYVGRYEITQRQYRAVMGENGSRDARDDHPVENITWFEAVEFCSRASQRTGRTVRLPTEVEWEYACRAGSDARYCFGDDPGLLATYAWFGQARMSGASGAQPVGRRRPNAWGLFDMHGNVAEWCAEAYGAYPNPSARYVPATAPATVHRTVRGGSWYDAAVSCRSAARRGTAAHYRVFYIGFRVVVDPAEGDL